MRALVYAPDAPQGIVLADAPEPVVAALPVRRMGTPDDVAHAAVFLMTNPQVTGAVLEITGGETLVDTLDVTS